jgi:L-fucose isomerase-like protein
MPFSISCYGNGKSRLNLYLFYSYDEGGKTMVNNQRLVLGFAPTRRKMYDPAFAHENRIKIKERIEDILSNVDVEIVDIDWLNEEGLLIELDDVPKVEEHFKKAKVDALFMPHCNFGSEEVVAKLGKAIGKPFLLWGPRDQAPPPGKAIRQTDTQCGLFASSRALQRYGVTFTYLENCWIDDKVFEVELMDFLRVASAVKTFKNMRIGQVSLRPKPFLSVMVNEGELLEKFGIEIVPITQGEIISKTKDILAGCKDEVELIVSDIKGKMDCSTIADDDMKKIAAVELAFMDLAKEHNCNVMASECWRTYREAFGIRPCFIFGDLIDRGLMVACETDINGAITMAMLKASSLNKGFPFLADLTIRHPENENAELLWHCGPFPQTLASHPEKRALIQFTGSWELKGGDITVARFDGSRGQYSLFAGKGVGVEGPSTNGNYVWIEVDDWIKWEKKFIYGPYIHHVACIHGDYVKIMDETCKYLKEVKIDLP